MSGIKKGSAALPTTILIAGIILEVSVAGALIAYYLSESGAGAKNSAEAFQAAQTGIQDATMRVIRGQFGSPYSLNVGDKSSADIIICQNAKYSSSSNDCSGGPNLGKVELVSLGKMGLKRRRLFAVLNVNSLSGEIKVEEVTEI